jgi:hypothetical protein
MAIMFVAVMGTASITGQVEKNTHIEQEKSFSQQAEISAYQKAEIKSIFAADELNKAKELVANNDTINPKSTITDVSVITDKDGKPILVVNKETVKEVAPQVNNYNFEKLSKVLFTLCGLLATVFGIKYASKLFKYLATLRRFSKQEKKTNKLIESLKRTIDNQKEFLLISNDIEHQLKINDLLLKCNEANRHGVNLEVADDYLYAEYQYINEKVIKGLQ